MPINQDELQNSKRTVNEMFNDTVESFQFLQTAAPHFFGEAADEISAAIDECLQDMFFEPQPAGLQHPEALIFAADLEDFQRAGFYGHQLALKQRQVTEANEQLRSLRLPGEAPIIRSVFQSWVSRINNFLRSLSGATGIGTALQEVKDAMADELPDDD